MQQQKLRILHVSPSYKPAYCYGGPILSVSRLCEAANNGTYNLECDVFTTTANGVTELDLRGKHIIDGVPVHFYPRITGDHTHFSPALLYGLHRYLRTACKKQMALVVHIHSWWNLVAVFAAMLVILHRVPLIISPRGMITSYTRTFRNTFFKQLVHLTFGKYLLRKAVLHATTALEAEGINRNSGASYIRVIPNLLTNATFDRPELEIQETDKLKPTKQSTGCSASDFRILFLSRIDQKKGLDILLKALSVVTFHWTLTIAGTGNSRYIRHLKQLSGSLKVSGKIKWVGQISNEDKYSLMAKHDLLVLPSSNENFGNVVLESLLAGTAVLVSDQVGLAAYVSEANLGWVCPATSEDIAVQLSNIHKDLSKRNRIRECGARQVQSDFNTHSIMSEYLNMYQDLIR